MSLQKALEMATISKMATMAVEASVVPTVCTISMKGTKVPLCV